MKIIAILLVILNAALLVPAVTAAYTPFIAIASLMLTLVLLVLSFKVGAAAKSPAKPAATEAVKPMPAAAPQNQAQAEVVTLLGVFQEKGRFIDFLMEDVAPFSDTEIGLVARAVHQGCKAALNEHFQIEPISPQGEGAAITIPADYTADEFRLVGKLTGEAPFTGKVVHKGWRATSVKLPRILNADRTRLPVIAPAQVEIP